jgi:hypothetical protein
MHHNIYHLWSVHGVASLSKIRRLINGCASSTTSVFGFLNLSCCYWHYKVVIPLLWWCLVT